MSTASIAVDRDSQALVSREAALQRLATTYISIGLLFMLLPGTFLGVWNLISISAEHTVATLSPAWLQAHGHAQIFGWLGTFILGIGFYSLSKMGNLAGFAVSRGWTCLAVWTVGLTLRWIANVVLWQWRVLLPLSAAMELAAFLIFFRTVSSHRPAAAAGPPRKKEAWMLIVVGSTMGFLLTLAANLGTAIWVALNLDSPALPHWLDQRMLVLPAWGFLIPAVWGFNSRWLPAFLGLRNPNSRELFAALFTACLAVLSALAGFTLTSTFLMPLAALLAISGLGIFERSINPPKIIGVHPSFPIFVRLAYVWLIIGALLSPVAALADQAGGIWGASRHALTVGFLATMVFAIGQRILPAFCGARVLFSRNLMFASLLLLNIGCALRVGSEIPAYEGYLPAAWGVLPVSAVTELMAVSLFALNLAITFLRPPAHRLREQHATS